MSRWSKRFTIISAFALLVLQGCGAPQSEDLQEQNTQNGKGDVKVPETVSKEQRKGWLMIQADTMSDRIYFKVPLFRILVDKERQDALQAVLDKAPEIFSNKIAELKNSNIDSKTTADTKSSNIKQAIDTVVDTFISDKVDMGFATEALNKVGLHVDTLPLPGALMPNAVFAWASGGYGINVLAGTNIQAVLYLVIVPYKEVICKAVDKENGVKLEDAKLVCNFEQWSFAADWLMGLAGSAGLGLGGGVQARLGGGAIWGDIYDPEELAGTVFSAAGTLSFLGGVYGKVFGKQNPTLFGVALAAAGGAEAELSIHGQISELFTPGNFVDFVTKNAAALLAGKSPLPGNSTTSAPAAQPIPTK